MNRGSILAILAGAGILTYGSLTPDAVALARALQSGSAAELLRFADDYRASPLAAQAMKLADGRRWCQPERRRIDGSCEENGERPRSSGNKNSGYQT